MCVCPLPSKKCMRLPPPLTHAHLSHSSPFAAALHTALCVPQLDAPAPRPSTFLTTLSYLGSGLLVVAVGGFYAAAALRDAYATGVSAGDLQVRRTGPRSLCARLTAPAVALLRRIAAAPKQRRD